ncbi:solute carrier family 35 member c2 [Ophiostoma piceae UAMH 11346]|uniref:Solute carrier family 35 member c2 n=1 Tax=Ophiostoma piceae (strain UAMH 11346) TaxID=1262450 RepID=S3C5T7_OPHP1|nr:solute carrier family 35 member c2 [Ophiostoma piceae UAMH 11346]
MPSPKQVRTASVLPGSSNTNASIELGSLPKDRQRSDRQHRDDDDNEDGDGWGNWDDDGTGRKSQDSLFDEDYDAEAHPQRIPPPRRINSSGHDIHRLLVGDDDDQDPVLQSVTEAERKEADQHVVRRLVINGSLIGMWYLFSLSISLYNKWMFGSNFPFPLFTTSIHMLVQFFLSCLVLYFVPSLRPDTSPEARMTRWFYLTRISPCGAATGLDIGLGNASLKLITLTFYTMCKSSSLAFVLLFAFAFRLEKPTMRLVAIIATMTVGVVMMVAGEVEFDTFGFMLVISAAFFSGFRWALTQIMLLRNPATSNPFSSIFFLAPVMFVTLFVLAIPMEGFGELAEGFRKLAADFGPLKTPLLVLFPGCIAFLMTASEFALLQRTSVVTLSIAGIFKEVVTIITASLVFHDTLTLVNFLGLIVTLAAITVYNYIKIMRMRKQAQIDVHKGHLPHEHDGEPSARATGTAPLGASRHADDANVDGVDADDREDAGLLSRDR